MKKLIIAYILGVLSFVMGITGVLSLFLSIPGLVLAIMSFKDKEKRIRIPIGYEGTVGKKKMSARPFMTTRYLSYVAVGLNAFSMAVSVITTLFLFSFLSAGMR